MGDICDQVGLHPLALELFLECLLETGSDAVDHFSETEFLARESVKIHLVTGVPACDH